MENFIAKIRPISRLLIAFVLVTALSVGWLLGMAPDPTLSGFAGVAVAFFYKEKE